MSPSYPTNLRGEFGAAILAFRWRQDGLVASKLRHRFPAGYVPDWVTMVPEGEERPYWVASWATVYAVEGGDRYYVWRMADEPKASA